MEKSVAVKELQSVSNARDAISYDSAQGNLLVGQKEGTRFDQRDMWRMGKLQELRRNFRFFSIFGFTMVLMATWETMLTYVRA
jgi:choline transport protein